ncbi:scavenger receptor cysteine-rich domain superfamily protein-like [Amphiura filiformis]|uniref:scavenger receptor cysteine-rich domain superfamily protein-like n=1 Tax=Amphiura filiformis TaxID=82378 RepID=UPI003B20BE3D
MFVLTVLLVTVLVAAQEPVEFRLVDGSNSTEGRIEVLYDSVWGTLCGTYWTAIEAMVLCRQLGLPYGSPVALKNAYFGEGSGTIWLDDVRCAGTEMSLDRCSHSEWGMNFCVHYMDAGVICTDEPQYRLVGGIDSTEGRVELLLGSRWGTVCDNSWDTADAKVVCRQLGLPYSSAVALKAAFFGEGSGDIWTDNVGCYGSETSLNQCSHSDWGSNLYCTHYMDAGVICTEEPQYRLVGGIDSTEGRVEVLLGSRWGTVCDNSWDAADAKVVCRQLGLPYSFPVALKGAFFGLGSRDIWTDNVGCYGSETSLDQCSHSDWGSNSYCTHYMDAGVICTNEPQYRLVGGINSTEGRVEVLLGSRWGTVCDISWDAADAKVVCRQLGLPYSFPVALKGAFFGLGSGDIWTDNVGCYGSETSLDQCSHIDWGSNSYCTHYMDAGVICTNGPTQYRLVGGSNSNEGRVEIRLGSVWGTVCDDHWDINEATVLCRQLGLPHGAPMALAGAYFGQGDELIWMDDVGCAGSELSLADCPHPGWGVHSCGHYKDAGVICAGDIITTAKSQEKDITTTSKSEVNGR